MKEKITKLAKKIRYPLILAIILIDQIIKLIVRASMTPGESKAVIGELFKITYVQNTGSAFGFFQGKTKVLMIATAVIMLGIVIAMEIGKNKSPLMTITYALILGGGVGNMIDRLVFGTVTDMFEVNIIKTFPVFNFADIAITIACILLIIYVIIPEKKEDESDLRDNN